MAGVQQSFSTIAGVNYQISLEWALTGNNSQLYHLFEVLWDGKILGQISGSPEIQWQYLSYTAQGTGMDTLAIEGYSDNGFNTIDNVSVSVPEPEPLAMFLLVLPLIGSYMKRKQSKVAA